MVQTAPTSHADQTHVPGATAVRVIGVLLALQGGWKMFAAINSAVQLFERAIGANYVFVMLVMSGVIGLFTVSAGMLLVRQDRSGKVFGLVVCSIALAHQLLTVGSTLTSFLYVLGRSPPPGMVFWTINVSSIVLYLVSIIVIARWHPPRVAGY